MDKSISDVIQEKLDGDKDFQESLANLKDDEKVNIIESKRKELLEAEFKALSEKAEKATKAEELANNYKKRAEGVEAELKKYKPVTEDKGLSTKDFYALTNAKVPEEDVDDVVEYAKFKNIPVSEALKSPVVKATLAEKAEARKTAQATQTRSTRSQNAQPDGAAILQDMQKGEDSMPEPGSKEAEAAFWARRGRKPQ